MEYKWSLYLAQKIKCYANPVLNFWLKIGTPRFSVFEKAIIWFEPSHQPTNNYAYSKVTSVIIYSTSEA